MADLIRGIDVSVLQGTIDFNAEKTSGRSFCVCRAGVGNDGIDQNVGKNVFGAKSAGMFVGVYHFIYPLPTIPSSPLRDPTRQAQYHFNAAQGVLPFCDLEWPVISDWKKWNCSANQIVDWTMTYLDAYQKLYMRPILYTYPDYMQQLGNPSAFANEKLWIASYETVPTIPKPFTSWVMWQFNGGAGKLSNGSPVDENYVQNLALWTGDAKSNLTKPVVSILTVPPAENTPTIPVPPPSSSAVIPEPRKPSLIELVWQIIAGWLKKAKT